MAVVWEEPPPAAPRAERFGRQPSPLRKEADEMLASLRQKQGVWARLWDMDTKENARKRSNYVGQKGFSFSVRETQYGWSVYGRYNGEPEPQPERPTPEPEPEPDLPSPDPVREPTFQV